MINNPLYYGGAMGPLEAEKAMRLVQLCDTFHLPLVWLCDEPGFHVGPENEVQGILRGGARAVTVFSASKMPYASVLRGGRWPSRPPQRHVPALRLAISTHRLYAHRRRHDGCVQARNSKR